MAIKNTSIRKTVSVMFISKKSFLVAFLKIVPYSISQGSIDACLKWIIYYALGLDSILTVIKTVVLSLTVFCLSMLFFESSFGRYQFAMRAQLLLAWSKYFSSGNLEFDWSSRKRPDLDNDGFLEFERFLLVRSMSTCVDLSIYKDMFNGSVCVCWSIDCRGTIINKSSISTSLSVS